MKKTEQTKWLWFVKEMENMAKKLVLEHECMPMMFAVLGLCEGQPTYNLHIAKTMNSTEDRNNFCGFISMICAMNSCRGLAMFYETFLSAGPNLEPDFQPILDPNRKDALTIHLLMPGHSSTSIWIVDKKARNLKKLEVQFKVDESVAEKIFIDANECRAPAEAEEFFDKQTEQEQAKLVDIAARHFNLRFDSNRLVGSTWLSKSQ